jgi:Flp pilus assembly protein TadD
MTMSSVERTAPPYILLVILLGFLSMFAATFYSLMDKPAAVNAGASGNTAVAPSDGDPEPTLSQEQADELSVLMRKVQSNPNDADALMEIGGIFLTAKEWGRAGVFLNRAVLSRPADTGPRYMLGIALYQQGRMQEAATVFEELLALENYPAAQYNLAIIYKYHMDKADEAKTLLERIMTSPDADVETVSRAKKELNPE